MRTIDADALLDTSDVFIVHTKEYGSIEVISVDAVGDAPTVDVVPVVRCRECVHYEMGVCLKIYDDGAASSYAWQKRNPDDFCSYGERKEGADNGS